MAVEWRQHEVEVLRQLYPVADAIEVCAALPRRAWHSIVKKANELKVHRPRPARRVNKHWVHPVCQQLRAVREQRGLRLTDVSDLCGYHENQLHMWELGKTRPTLQYITDWANALGFELILRPQSVAKTYESTIAPVDRSRLMAGRA